MKKYYKNRIFFSIIIGLLLLLSACTIEVHTKVNKDGSGEFSYSFFITNDELALFTGGAGDYGLNLSTDEICEGMGSEFSEADFPTQPTMKAKETADGIECQMSVPFDSIDQLRLIYGDNDFDEFFVELDDSGNFTYRVVANSEDLDTGDIQDYSDLDIDVSVLWKVTAPGKITSTNGNKTGNTVTWDLMELSQQGGAVTMEVQSGKGGGGGIGDIELPEGVQEAFQPVIDIVGEFMGLAVLLLFCCCCGIVLVIGGIIYFIFFRKKDQN